MIRYLNVVDCAIVRRHYAGRELCIRVILSVNFKVLYHTICVGLFNLRGSDKINALFYAYAVLFHDNAR